MVDGISSTSLFTIAAFPKRLNISFRSFYLYHRTNQFILLSDSLLHWQYLSPITNLNDHINVLLNKFQSEHLNGVSNLKRVTKSDVLKRSNTQRGTPQHLNCRKISYLGHILKVSKYRLIHKGKFEGRKLQSWLRNIRDRQACEVWENCSVRQKTWMSSPEWSPTSGRPDKALKKEEVIWINFNTFHTPCIYLDAEWRCV